MSLYRGEEIRKQTIAVSEGGKWQSITARAAMTVADETVNQSAVPVTETAEMQLQEQGTTSAEQLPSCKEEAVPLPHATEAANERMQMHTLEKEPDSSQADVNTSAGNDIVCQSQTNMCYGDTVLADSNDPAPY